MEQVGSSGSPIFETNTHQLVGVRFAGNNIGRGIGVIFNPTVYQILNNLRLAIGELNHLQSYINLLETLPLNLVGSTVNKIRATIEKIFLSLGNTSPYMRVIIPTSRGILTFFKTHIRR